MGCDPCGAAWLSGKSTGLATLGRMWPVPRPSTSGRVQLLPPPPQASAISGRDVQGITVPCCGRNRILYQKVFRWSSFFFRFWLDRHHGHHGRTGPGEGPTSLLLRFPPLARPRPSGLRRPFGDLVPDLWGDFVLSDLRRSNSALPS